jgi:hypothetical protein
MKSRIENGNLVIELPLEKPRPSSTGKTLLVASTRGVIRTTAQFKGKTISVVANAFVFSDGLASEASKKSSKTRIQEDEEEGDQEDC